MLPKVRSLEFVLLGAVLISLPGLLQAFSGGVSVATALLRLCIALVLCGVAGTVIERLVDAYSRQARQRELQARIEAIRRAREDAPAGR